MWYREAASPLLWMWYRGLYHILPDCITFCSGQVNDNTAYLVSAISVLFLLIGLLIFGIESSNKIGNGHQSYSYAFSCISTILCLAAGVLTVVQLRKAKTAAWWGLEQLQKMQRQEPLYVSCLDCVLYFVLAFDIFIILLKGIVLHVIISWCIEHNN